MHIRVELDVNLPLKRFKKIKFNGGLVQVSFKYEKLQTFCFICGKLGHTESFCDTLFILTEAQVEAMRQGVKGWGLFLKADDRKLAQSAGDCWLRTRDGGLPGQTSGPRVKAQAAEEGFRANPNSDIFEDSCQDIPKSDNLVRCVTESTSFQNLNEKDRRDFHITSNPIFMDSSM